MSKLKKKPVKKAPKKPVKKTAARKKQAKSAAKYVLVLRTCDSNLRSHGGFQWPKSGPVACKDWDSEPVCGGGLHGLLWGEGGGGYLDWSETAKWLVVRVLESEIVSIGGDKVKFPRGKVVFCGDRIEATKYIADNGGTGKAIVGGTATAGYGGTATAGYGGTATAGVGGTATAGDRGTATAGYGGTATAGDGGAIQLDMFDASRRMYRKRCSEVGGKGGLKPNVKYRLNDAGEFVEVKP